MKRVFFLLSIILLISSCGLKPPKDLLHTDVLDIAEDIGTNIIDFLNDFSAFNYMNAKWIPHKGLFVMKNGDEIFFIQKPWESTQKPKSPYILTSAPNGKVKLMQDIYISKTYNDKILYSFDNVTWFSTDGDPKKFENFYPMLNIEQKRENRQLKFTFEWALREGSSPHKSSFSSKGLKIVNLSPNLVINDSENNKLELNLRENILFLPKGTLIEINILLDSNFLQFYRINKTTACFRAIEDIYLYKTGWMLSASFDGSYWRDNFFAYKFDFKSSFVVNAKGMAVIKQEGYILNKKLLKRQIKAGKKVPFFTNNH